MAATVDTIALFRQFIREQFAAFSLADATFAAGEDPQNPTSDCVYVYPHGLPEGFPENGRAVVFRELPEVAGGTRRGHLATPRFYVRTYGSEPKDADYLARVLYGFSVSPSGGWRYGWKIGDRFVKWITYEGKPIADTDDNDRAVGFLIANMRLGIR